MDKSKLIGVVFIFISIIISLTNILSVKITGAFLGVDIKSSLLTIFTFIFFFGGIFIMGSLEKRASNWEKGIAIASLAALLGMPMRTHIKDKNNVDSEANTKPKVEETIKVVSPYSTIPGRFERTYRWDKILDEVEGKYELPRGILKGLAMQESYGDPLRLNEGKKGTGDGGAGLFMFQPRTAKAYGLKVYGNSNKSSADTIHGAELKKLIRENNYEYSKMLKYDDRFNPKKAAEAAARYLRDDYAKYHDWDKVLSAYNQGKPAPKPEETKHVKAVRKFQNYYNERDTTDNKFPAQKPNTKGHSNIKKKR